MRNPVLMLAIIAGIAAGSSSMAFAQDPVSAAIGTAIAGEKFDTSSILNTPLLDYLVNHHALAGRPGAGRG